LSLRDATTTERSTVTQIDILYSFTGSNGETGSLNASFTNLVIPTSLITPLDFSGTVTFTGTCTMNGLTTNISGNGSGGVKMDSEGITPYYNATINYSDTDGVSATAQLSSDGSCTGTVMYQGYTIGTISLDSNGKVTYTETVSGQAVILAEELYQLLQ
jgi:hypothetical protein